MQANIEQILDQHALKMIEQDKTEKKEEEEVAETDKDNE